MRLQPKRTLRLIFRKWGVPVLALAVVWLSSLTPLYQRLGNVLDDTVLAFVAKSSTFDNTVVIDIDDASLRALKGQLGPWPYPRDVYAMLLLYLRDAGAKSVVFDFVFGDTREGDEAFSLAIAKRSDVVLAASGLRLPMEHDTVLDALPARLTSPVVPGAGSTSWSSMTLPTPLLLASLNQLGGVGVISASLDADRRLRRLPLLHDSNGRLFPSLPLAAHLLQQSRSGAVLSSSPAYVNLRNHRWPIDAAGRALMLLPSNATQIPTLSFMQVAHAALGEIHDDALAKAIAGRTVFVGSSSFLGDTVATPQGELTGTALLANAYVSLGRDDVVQQAPWPYQTGFFVLGLLPCIFGLSPKKILHARDVLITGGVLGLMVLLVLWGLGNWRILVSGFPALLVLFFSWIFYMLSRRQVQLQAHFRLENERHVANAANVAKSQFLAHVSHELRTPLNAVLGMAEVLVRTELSSEQRRYVGIFQHAGGLLASLLDDLLDLSKIEADRLLLNIHPFSLHALVAQQIELLKSRAVDKGISLSHTIDAQVPDVVQGDAKRLTQILVNLIGNAIKFTAVGGVRVRVTVDAQAKVCFSIRDSGIGIAQSKVDLIFEPFAQADAGVARYYGGTGLGLSISKRLIELMGGRIWVESEPGLGSTFRLTLILPKGVLPDAVPDLGSLAGTDPVVRDYSAGVLILLAEDNELNVLVIEAMLQKTPHTLALAGSGDVAVEMFKTGLYGLVLMDVQMPVMDGLQATREIRKFETGMDLERTSIVALTAGAYREDERLSREAGCDAHIGKPVSQQQLLDAIERLGRPRASPVNY
jgi:signal transduction histidine kinase/CheY-like chemotaxis protein